MSRVRPLTGSDTSRRIIAAAGLLQRMEIHSTNDQLRLFLENTYVGGSVFHDEVATGADMLLLNATTERGVFPGDICRRDDTGSLFLCIANRGEASSDWIDMSAAGDFLVGGFFDETAYADIFSGGTFVSPPTDRLLGGRFKPTILGGFF